MLFRRLTCPHCGGGLSRTLVHPEWLSLAADQPVFRLPLFPALLGIVALGLALSLFHPALAVAGVVAFGGWLGWRYFAWFQCDACSRFFFGGQLSTAPGAVRPWTPQELKRLGTRVAVCGGLLLAVFLPLKYVEGLTQKQCDARCAQSGKDGQTFIYRCTCVSKENQ